MRTPSRRLALGVLLLLGCVQGVAAQTADEIIEKSLTAVGGRAALAKLKTRSMTGTITLQTPAGDITGSIETLNAVPNKGRSLIKADLTSLGAGQLVIDQRFDGAAGYVLDSLQGNRDLTGDPLEVMRNNYFPTALMKYKDLGMTVKLDGKQKVGDRDAHVLVVEPTSGPGVRQFIDAETFLPLRVVMKVNVPQLGRELEQTTDLLDYRDVDGVKIPYEIRASSAVQSYTIKVEKVEHNGAIDETVFSKPKQ